MFRSLPRMIGFGALVLCVGAILFSTSATGQGPQGQGWVNGNHVPKAKPAKFFPPIFDKGFRPGFGVAPVIESPRPRPPLNQLLGGNNQGNQGNQGFGGNVQGFGGNQGGFGGNVGGFGGNIGGFGGQQGFGGGGFQGFGGGGLQGFGGGSIQGLGGGGGIISFGGISGSIQIPPQIGGTNYLGMQGGIFGLTGGQFQGGQLGQLGQLGGGIQGFGGGFQGLGGGFQGLGGGGFQGIGGGFGGQQGFKGIGFSGGYGI